MFLLMSINMFQNNNELWIIGIAYKQRNKEIINIANKHYITYATDNYYIIK